MMRQIIYRYKKDNISMVDHTLLFTKIFVLFVGKWYNNSYVGANVAVPLIEPRSKPDPLDQARPDQQRGM